MSTKEIALATISNLPDEITWQELELRIHLVAREAQSQRLGQESSAKAFVDRWAGGLSGLSKADHSEDPRADYLLNR